MRPRLTRRATQQLEAIRDRLGRLSPQGRVSVTERVAGVVLVSSEHPCIGRPTSQARVRRIVLVPFPCVIDYRLEGDMVATLGVRHTSRKAVS